MAPLSEFLACAPNLSLGCFSEAKVSENLFVIPLGPKPGLSDAAVAGNTGTYDVWEGAEAFVQFEVKPVAVKTASGLISSNASIGYPGKQRTQKEPSPITGDYEVLAISGPGYPIGLTNSQIDYGEHLLFTFIDTIESELKELFPQGEACASARCWKDTKSQVVDSTTSSNIPSKHGADQKLDWVSIFII